jgi:hypothetical protein
MRNISCYERSSHRILKWVHPQSTPTNPPSSKKVIAKHRWVWIEVYFANILYDRPRLVCSHQKPNPLKRSSTSCKPESRDYIIPALWLQARTLKQTDRQIETVRETPCSFLFVSRVILFRKKSIEL